MNCEEIRKSLPLMLYGELSFEQEEMVESHLDACDACRREMVRHRSMQAILDDCEIQPSPFMLRDARLRLDTALQQEPSRASFLDRFASYFKLPVMAKPIGAVALVAVGFFGARVMPTGTLPGLQSAGMFDPNTARVRFVEPGPGGQIQIVVDEMRQRVVSGRLDDAKIRGLLLAAVRDPSDPGLRVESVELLKSKSGESDVRDVLIYALQHDGNDGVRLKALEGLKPFASQVEVRKALSQALLGDKNPSIRAQAIDLLMKNSQEQQLVGVLQELMRTEENGYIRGRCERALKTLNASVETY